MGASTDSETNDGPGAWESCNLRYQRMESNRSGFLTKSSGTLIFASALANVLEWSELKPFLFHITSFTKSTMLELGAIELPKTKVWQEIKCYFCVLAHTLSNIESILIK